MTLQITGLSGKRVLVTGVSRKIGIGAAVAHRFAQAGAHVFTTYFRPYDAEMSWGSNAEEAGQIIESLKQLGVKAGGVEADLSDPDIPAWIFDQAEAVIGPVDILINNAVHDTECRLGSVTAAVLDQHYAVNLRAPALLCDEFFRRHDGRPGGRVISMTSGQGLGPMPDQLGYASTKGGLEALTVSLVPGMATKGITVNVVDPGATDTGWMSDSLKAELLQLTHLGRIGVPEDAANLILFLASPAGGWITGQVIRSRGGLF